MTEAEALKGLPGGAWVERALGEARAGTWSAEALALAVAPRRLRELGLELPGVLPPDPELCLYERLRSDGVDDAYGRYNALLREFDSFLEALTARRGRERLGSSASADRTSSPTRGGRT